MREVRGGRLRIGASMLSACLLLAACTAQDETSQSEQSQSGQQSGFSAEPEQTWDEGRREADYPLITHELPNVPFKIRAPRDAVEDETVVLSARNAVSGVERIVELGAAESSSPPEVLTLLPEGSGFGVGIDEQSSLPEVGLITPEGGFTSLSALPGVAAANYLPNGVPYQTLNAFAAASSPRVVVWVAADESGEIWSLMCWNRDEGVLQELASSASMASSHVDSGALLSTNGRYAVFSADVPASALLGIDPGDPVSVADARGVDQDNQQFVSATFRVPVDSPGEVHFLGSNLQARTDPVLTGGVLAVAPDSEISSAETLSSTEEAVQSSSAGEPQSENWSLDLTPWQPTWRSSCSGDQGSECPDGPPRLVYWSDDQALEPLFTVEDPQTWQISDLSVSDRYVVVLVGGGSDHQGSAPSSEQAWWLLVWDLEKSQLKAAIETGSPVRADASSRLVVWSEVSPSSSDSVSEPESPQSGAPQSGEEQAAPVSNLRTVVFDPADEGDTPLYWIPFAGTEEGPKASDDILAVRTVDDEGAPNWTFLQWK